MGEYISIPDRAGAKSPQYRVVGFCRQHGFKGRVGQPHHGASDEDKREYQHGNRSHGKGSGACTK